MSFNQKAEIARAFLCVFANLLTYNTLWCCLPRVLTNKDSDSPFELDFQQGKEIAQAAATDWLPQSPPVSSVAKSFDNEQCTILKRTGLHTIRHLQDKD